MPQWFAIISIEDRFDGKRRLEYRAGDVCSWTTEELSAEDQAARKVRAVPIGEHPESGPDFRAKEWDLIKEELVDRPAPPAKAEELLFQKPLWTEADKEMALRLLLGKLKDT